MSESVENAPKTQDEKDEKIVNTLFGRREIITAVEDVTRDNLLDVLVAAIATHEVNAAQIDYLWRYMRGEQPILFRTKLVRPEICNKVVENHASEIAQFTSGYFLGEPVTYTRRGERAGASDEINLLNNYMFSEDKASHDKNLSMWMSVCGVGYRMVMPDRKAGEVEEDEAPFEIDTLDPRTTFVVYNSGFGHHRIMGCRVVYRSKRGKPFEYEVYYCGYTRTHYFEVKEGSILVWKPHGLDDIPIFEYTLNMARMGSFEPAIPLLDAMNRIQSNRLDGLEQFVQAFLKFKNCDVDDDDVARISKLGAVFIKNADGLDSDVSLVSQELNQSQVQELVDYLYQQVLTICGMPTTTKGGRSTSDTGEAVFLRDGWSQCEARARDTELLFKRSEKQFLRQVLQIVSTMRKGFNLQLSEVECKFTRRQHDNLQSKAQALQAMLQAGLHPEVAIASCGLFNDPMDVYQRSLPYLQKWDYVPLVPEKTETPDDNNDEGDDVNV